MTKTSRIPKKAVVTFLQLPLAIIKQNNPQRTRWWRREACETQNQLAQFYLDEWL